MIVEKAIPRWCTYITGLHYPDIIAIRHKFGRDHCDDLAVFFTIVVSNEIITELQQAGEGQCGKCGELIQQVQNELRSRIPLHDMGYHAYFTIASR